MKFLGTKNDEKVRKMMKISRISHSREIMLYESPRGNQVDGLPRALQFWLL